ncbi:MAG: cupin domain-containing protein [Deltaproteobacteria bacterium]|nr:cupin domain-containing protein [Deltaproteobacteria bacterium]
MRAPRARMALCSVAIAASALAAPAEPAAPALDAVFATGRLTLPLEALASRYPLAPGKDFQVSEIGRDEHSSHHAVWIVDREIPHRHDRHDLFVVMLRGHGAMRLGDEERPVGEGSILYVPRGMPHAFRNASGAPALAYAIYAPAFDGRDRVPVD